MTEYILNPDCLRTDIDDEAIFLNTETGKYLKLNSTSRFILDCILENLEEHEILKKINIRYKISEVKAKLSVTSFIENALEKNIIIIK